MKKGKGGPQKETENYCQKCNQRLCIRRIIKGKAYKILNSLVKKACCESVLLLLFLLLLLLLLPISVVAKNK